MFSKHYTGLTKTIATILTIASNKVRVKKIVITLNIIYKQYIWHYAKVKDQKTANYPDENLLAMASLMYTVREVSSTQRHKDYKTFFIFIYPNGHLGAPSLTFYLSQTFLKGLCISNPLYFYICSVNNRKTADLQRINNICIFRG